MFFVAAILANLHVIFNEHPKTKKAPERFSVTGLAVLL
jgi:hypothetical protein